MDPVNRASNHNPSPPSDDSSLIRRETGDPAVLIAELIAISERTQDSARASRSANRAMRRELNEKRFEAMEDAADARFAAGITSGVTQAASAGVGYAQSAAQSDQARAHAAGDTTTATQMQARGTNLQSTSQAIGATGKLFETGFDRAAAGEDIEAARYQEAAQSASERADEASDDIRRAQGRQDKALQHLADISQARMQAQITASRG